jgi:serine/threonine-protein kinase RsbW
VNSPAGSATVQRALRVDGDRGDIETVATLVRELADQAGLSRRQAYWLRLAAEEIITNVFHHGYQGRGPVWVTGEIAADEVSLLIEDESPAFDPLKQDRHARLAVDPADREEGGFGLLLAMHRLDGFCYEYLASKNRNKLIMRRTQSRRDA